MKLTNALKESIASFRKEMAKQPQTMYVVMADGKPLGIAQTEEQAVALARGRENVACFQLVEDKGFFERQKKERRRMWDKLGIRA